MLLAKDKNKVYIYGMEGSEELNNIENIEICNNMREAVSKTRIIIGPTPFSKEEEIINAPYCNEDIKISDFLEAIKTKTLIAGSLKENVNHMAKSKEVNTIDLMRNEELAILNTIATAEGAIKEIIQNTETIIQGSNILILGFGRVGKTLAKKLKGLDARITCSARKEEDRAWIRTYGYEYNNINELKQNLAQYDIIINTVPSQILDEEKLCYINKDCLIIDLASAPGGIDREKAKEKGIKVVWALAIPGKIAPLTSARFIKDVIYSLVY